MFFAFDRFRVFLLFLAFFLLQGCGGNNLEKIAEGTLGAVGLYKAADDVTKGGEHKVSLQIHAGGNLNADSKGRPMAVVLKVYRLKNPDLFMQTPSDVLASTEGERQALNGDLVDVKEVVVTPGQEIQRDLVVGGDGPYLGVVVLFHHPFPERWKFVFSGKDKANEKGIVIGVHECAMTVSEGVPYQSQLINPGSLGGVVCQKKDK